MELNSSLLVDYEKLIDDPSKVTAAITRAQWDDYVARYVPVENRLMDMTTYNNPTLAATEVSDNVAATAGAADLAGGSRTRNLARYGLSQSMQQQTAASRSDAINRSLSAADAANRTRQNLIDRNRLIAVGGNPTAALAAQ